MARDLYQELGVARGASADEIRKAFRKLAKANHPDTNPGDKASEEKFKRVSAAFDIVGDVEKRRKFDAGEIDADGRETMRGYGGSYGGGYGGAQGQAGGFRTEFENIDLSDILGEVFGRGAGARQKEGPTGGFGGFGGFGPQRGADVRAKLEIDLEDAIQGAKKRIAFSDGRTIELAIPKGANDGQTLRLKGQGAPGKGGPGDAFIELSVRPHPIFRREGDNLIMELPVTVYDAVLGGKVQAPTPDGPVSITVPKGANAGSVLRLKGRGAPDARGKRGDLLVRVMVTLPENPDPQLEKFAAAWRKERPYSPKRRS